MSAHQWIAMFIDHKELSSWALCMMERYFPRGLNLLREEL